MGGGDWEGGDGNPFFDGHCRTHLSALVVVWGLKDGKESIFPSRSVERKE